MSDTEFNEENKYLLNLVSELRLEKEKPVEAEPCKHLWRNGRCLHCQAYEIEVVLAKLKAVEAERDQFQAKLDDPDARHSDVIDLLNDEISRIRALTDNQEIIGICDRSKIVVEQRVPMIEQRDRLAKEVARFRVLLEEIDAAPNPHSGLCECETCEVWTSAKKLLPKTNSQSL